MKSFYQEVFKNLVKSLPLHKPEVNHKRLARKCSQNYLSVCLISVKKMQQKLVTSENIQRGRSQREVYI